MSHAEREVALRRCQEHDLDVSDVIIKTQAIIRDEVILVGCRSCGPLQYRRTLKRHLSRVQNFPRPDGPLPPILKEATVLMQDELRLCLSVEWLTYDSSTYTQLLSQGNAVIRLFLCE